MDMVRKQDLDGETLAISGSAVRAWAGSALGSTVVRPILKWLSRLKRWLTGTGAWLSVGTESQGRSGFDVSTKAMCELLNAKDRRSKHLCVAIESPVSALFKAGFSVIAIRPDDDLPTT